MRNLRFYTLGLLAALAGAAATAAGPAGYYRQPALHKDTLVFVSEGDLWKISAAGGAATRLTSHAGDEGLPSISPDGTTLAFTAQYEGPTEVYTMPLSGGRPTRRTVGAGRVSFVGWTPGGKLLYSTDRRSGLPNQQLVALDIATHGARETVVPLAQAAEGCFDELSRTLFFTRLPFQGSHTRRYKGGTAQNLWKFDFAADAEEAEPLTPKFAGTSKNPMWYDGRVYFASDRDGHMNLWSMKPDGSDPRQHTQHKKWDLASPSLSECRIAYQHGADIYLHDIAGGKSAKVPITLTTDLDQTRERWVRRPLDYLTAAHPSPDGDRVVLTARGRVYVVPHRHGRLVEATRKHGVRYRDARFLPGGKDLLALSDESGEVELWTMPADGMGKAARLTRGGTVLRWQALPSPDGKWIAHHDKDHRLYVHERASGKDRLIDEATQGGFNITFSGLAWSPDSKWLAYAAPAANLFSQVKLYGLESGKVTAATTDRFNSTSPAWSADGKWLYFLSDRNLRSIVPGPWGNYQPEPFLDKKTRIYLLALTPGQRSPFEPADELAPPKDKKKHKKESKKEEEKASPPPAVTIDLGGIQVRLREVPVPAGNYRNLQVNDQGLFWLSSPTGGGKVSLMAAPIADQDVEVKTVADDVRGYELSADGKKLLLNKGTGPAQKLYILDAAPAPATLAKKEVDLSGWSLSVVPQEEWKQMFDEAWRLERDYFYDRGMHGLDWRATRAKYLPLVRRVHSRAELSDLIAQMVAELSALHIFVGGGDLRRGGDAVAPASLGAVLNRFDQFGGYVVRQIYQSDPDEPERMSPLSRPGARVQRGEVIVAVDGVPALSVPDIGLLLRNKAGRQVRLRLGSPFGGKPRDVIVKPISAQAEADLRYHEWEYTRRQTVERFGKGELGYVHLRAMGGGNFTDWAKGYYPVFNRKGLIIDVRHNRGGNIDSWILGRLLRKPWFYWNHRIGQPATWNMQYAFRGHMVVLVNEYTASDGEAFAEGFRRLGLGKVIGTRTWGGEIWLSSSNFLVDRGIATSAEFGVYGPEGVWLIEGHGVEPDIVVDNRPRATYQGRDAQLEAAIAHLQRLIKDKPIRRPAVPKYPDKSFPKLGAGR
jgi:tricorn protease